MIECSNVYADRDGNEIVSPVEYETLGLMGTNCGLTDPDDLAMLNFHANDLGIDTIETGAMMAVLMEAGLAPFGDVGFLRSVLDEIRAGTPQGRLWAQGTARVGAHYGVQRTPVIKQQAISAYDPRVIEVTGISMMVTAQGADHTTGNAPKFDCAGKTLDELVAVSMETQVLCAAADSLGLCVFGRTTTNTNLPLMVQALNDALGTELPPDFFQALGRETLRLEAIFNRDAGFTAADDELPAFLYEEALAPSERRARFHADEVNRAVSAWWDRQPRAA
jgi:aldehyde:ferredoxin oxidoreductase